MGYWNPPPPTVFNPVPRPFHYRMENDGPYPEPEDEAFYGCGRSTVSGGAPLPVNQFDDAQGPRMKQYGDVVCVGGYGAGFDFKKKSPAQRLAYYRKMIALVMPPEPWNNWPGDPPQGGLGPDIMLPAGIALQYFDCSDSETPRRKRIWYRTGKDGDPVTKQRVPGETGITWEDEGFDYDRDLPQIFQVAFTAVGVFAGAALAFVSADPAVIQMIGGALGQMAKAARPGGSIDPFAYISNIAAATKAIPEFNATMLNVALKNDMVASLYSEAVKLRTLFEGAGDSTMDFVNSMRATVDKYQAMVPKFAAVDYSALTNYKIPPNLLKLTKGAWDVEGPYAGKPTPAQQQDPGPKVNLDAVLQATAAFNSEDPFVYYSRRKLVTVEGGYSADIAVAWRTSFDATYAALRATQNELARMQYAYAPENFPNITIAQQVQTQKINAQKELDGYVTLLKSRYHMR